MGAKKLPPLTDTKRIQFILDDHETRIDALEKAKIGTDAVAEYLLKHPAQVAQPESKLNKDLIKYIGVALGIIGALIYLLQGVLQVVKP